MSEDKAAYSGRGIEDDGAEYGGVCRGCCRYWKQVLGSVGICRRYPSGIPKNEEEWCGEIVTNRTSAATFSANHLHNEIGG